MWKVRCDEVLKIELPMERAELYRQIVELRDRSADAFLRDRGLFDNQNVPKVDDDLNRIKQWL